MIAFFVTARPLAALVLQNLEDFGSSGSPFAYLFFILMQCAFSWLLLPGLSYFNIAMGFFLKNVLVAWLIATFGAWGAAQVLFLFARYALKPCLLKKFGDSIIFVVLREEVKEKPWITATMVNVLLIPTAIKNYTLPLTDLRFYQYALPSLPFYGLFSALLVFIGDSISNVRDITGGKGFGE